MPLQDRTRALMFSGQFLGSLGVSFLQVFLALDMLRFGVTGMMDFFITSYAVSGLILFPMMTWLYFNKSRCWFFAVIIGTEFMALVPLFAPEILQVPMLVGACRALASAGYWQAFHLAMAAHTSDQGRGYEVTLSQIFQTLGGIVGGLAGGAAIALHADASIALCGFAVEIIATIMFLRRIPKPQQNGTHPEAGQIQATNLRNEIFNNPQRSFLTLLDAVYAVMVDILMPAWLKLMGVAAFSIGVVHALRTTIQVIVAPLRVRTGTLRRITKPPEHKAD
ncbi:MAG: MFS transporter [Alphaproteobacteria bacterium]